VADHKKGRHILRDAYLTVDPACTAHGIRGADNDLSQLPPGHQIAGATVMRKGPL
jgi:hypothetical protein